MLGDSIYVLSGTWFTSQGVDGWLESKAPLARVVVAGIRHHVTQRGNRRQETFFVEDDYDACLALLRHWCGRRGVGQAG